MPLDDSMRRPDAITVPGPIERFRQWTALARGLVSVPCPLCGGRDRERLFTRDRYLLPVEVSRCRECGLVHTARGLAGSDAARFHRDVYPWMMGYGDEPTPVRVGIDRQRAAFRALRTREAHPGFTRVLDIGCGLGFFLAECRALGASALFGIEPDPASRRFAADRLGLGGCVTGTPVEALDAPPFQPDLVTMFHVLEHLDDPGAVLRRVAGWMAPEGRLVVEVPDILGDWSSIGLKNIHLSHRSYFTAGTLGALLAANGFEAEVVTRADDDGIHPGNLRIVARPGVVREGAPSARDADVVHHIRRTVRPWSLSHGYPRAVASLLRRMTKR